MSLMWSKLFPEVVIHSVSETLFFREGAVFLALLPHTGNSNKACVQFPLGSFRWNRIRLANPKIANSANVRI